MWTLAQTQTQWKTYLTGREREGFGQRCERFKTVKKFSVRKKEIKKSSFDFSQLNLLSLFCVSKNICIKKGLIRFCYFLVTFQYIFFFLFLWPNTKKSNGQTRKGETGGYRRAAAVTDIIIIASSSSSTPVRQQSFFEERKKIAIKNCRKTLFARTFPVSAFHFGWLGFLCFIIIKIEAKLS